MLPFNAVVYSADEITERMSRRIAKARKNMMPMALELSDKGYLDPIPTEWDDAKRETQARLNLQIEAEMSDDKLDAMNNYQSELILTMLKSWDNGDITLDSVLDLKKADFEALSNACDEALRGSIVELEPTPDPKAPAADSLV